MNARSGIPAMENDIHGTGEPLVLLPGGLTGWSSWIPHAERLSATRKVIRLQPHNVALGQSGEPLPPHYSAHFEIAAFAKTMDNLSLGAFDLAGWSYGALIALSYAIHHPQRVRSLTLIEPPAYWTLRRRGQLPDALLDEQRFFRTLASDDISENQMTEFAHYTGLVPVDVDPRTLPAWPRWLSFRQSLRIADSGYRHVDSLERVRAFQPPVLLVKGHGSNPHTHAIVDLLAGSFPNAEAAVFPGGHAPHIVSMDPFLDSFSRFLAQPA